LHERQVITATVTTVVTSLLPEREILTGMVVTKTSGPTKHDKDPYPDPYEPITPLYGSKALADPREIQEPKPP
jgi:hypothetical protein